MADKQSRGVVETNYGLMWEFVRHTDKGAVGRREVSEGVYDYRDIPFAEISYLDDGGAEKSAKQIGEALTVKLNVDVSDAITGLKAVQREAKEATKALRYVEHDLSDVPVAQLARELRKREGITVNFVDPGETLRVDIENDGGSTGFTFPGPAEVIAIKYEIGSDE